ncbi:nuclear transport factor 2 family protein [Coralloluteibacterium stylophorae]|uniref:Nuclear transport factor 2 family protein n=2 Tax=Coralloluteibacterium stylophorae TaxID=1776034 RepID=A0A8J7VVY9_9GAMM|nr:nuclear transport factor 2 family protein [Coralloluteibacterium stylophorae]
MATCLLVLAACSRTPSEEALRVRIAAMAAAVEARDAGAVLAPVAEDFGGPDGLDRDGLARLVRLSFLRNAGIGTTLGPMSVQVDGERARVGFDAGLTGGRGLLPERAQLYAVETGWRFEDGEWMLISAQWTPRL